MNESLLQRTILITVFLLVGVTSSVQAQSSQPFKAGLVTTAYDETSNTATVEIRVKTDQDFLGGSVTGLQLTLRAPQGDNTVFGDVVSSPFGLERGTATSESGTEGGYRFQYYSAGGAGAVQDFTADQEVIWATIEVEGDKSNVIELAISSYAQSLSGGSVDGTYFLQYSGSSNGTDGQYYYADNSTKGNEFYATSENLEPGEANLPVELTKLDVIEKGGSILLQWSTASETNNRGFAVERKRVAPDQKEASQWKEVTFVEGAGTTSEAQTYRFTDERPPYEAETLIYRLRQVDRDGSASFSEEVEISLSAPDEFALHDNFPNPFREATRIRYALPQPEQVTLVVYDAVGQKVATLISEQQTAGRQQVRFDASELPSGVYFYRLRAGSHVETKSLTVLK